MFAACYAVRVNSVLAGPGWWREEVRPETSSRRRVEGILMVLAGRARKPAQPLEFASFSCESLAEAEPRALGFTYWFEAAPDGEPYDVAVRFVGRRSDVRGRPGPRDQFEVVRTVSSVIPGSGPIALATRVTDIATGKWNVTAIPKPLPRGDPAAAEASRTGAATGMSIPHPQWASSASRLS